MMFGVSFIALKKFFCKLCLLVCAMSTLVSVFAISFLIKFEAFFNNRTKEEKYGVMELNLERELLCDFENSKMIKDDLSTMYEKQGFNSDFYWFSVESQEVYDDYKNRLELPEFILPSSEKIYILSMGRKIEEFNIAPILYSGSEKPYYFWDYYIIACENLESPQYRGIAKYDSNSYSPNTVYVYSANKISLIDPIYYEFTRDRR